MKRPCPVTLNGCPGADSPVTNLSSEAPDPLLFVGYGWSPYNPWRIPILGGGPVNDIDCSNITWSSVSQEMADLLAFLNAQFCEVPDPVDTVPPPLPGIPTFVIPTFEWTPPELVLTPPEYQTFTNDRQFASVTCPNGSVFTLSIEAGTVVSPPLPVAAGPAWVAYINAFLLAYLLQQLIDQRVCMDASIEERVPPTEPPTPVPGPGGTPVGGPTVAGNPGWLCFGETLTPEANTYNITGGSSSASYTFSISEGSIPPGTDLIQTGPHTAVLTGTPTVSGNYSFTVHAVRTDNLSIEVSVEDELHVFGLTSLSLPDGTVSSPYSEQLQGAGGTAPYTFTGTPPTGFTLSSSGTLANDNPLVAGDYSFDVTVTDANGLTCVQTVDLTIAVPADSVKICNWDTDVLPVLVTPAFGCSGSGNPAWTGVFDQHDISENLFVPGWNGKLYYFTGRSITVGANTMGVSPDDLASYPSGSWKDVVLWHYTRLYYDSTAGAWTLEISCAVSAMGFSDFLWIGYFTTPNTTNPEGIYTSAGPYLPATIEIRNAATCCCLEEITPTRPNTGIEYSYQITPTFGTAPYTYTGTNLPDGLSLNHTTGLISGVPTTVGIVYSTIRVTDSMGVCSECEVLFNVIDGAILNLTWNLYSGGSHDCFGGSNGTVTVDPNPLLGANLLVTCQNDNPALICPPDGYPTSAAYYAVGDNTTGMPITVRVRLTLTTDIPPAFASAGIVFGKYIGAPPINGWENTTIQADNGGPFTVQYDYTVLTGPFGIYFSAGAGNWTGGYAACTVDMQIL